MEIKFMSGINAWKDFNRAIDRLISENRFTDIAEIGAGANPLLSLDYVKEQKLNYHIIDVSEDELAKANPAHRKIVLDLEARKIATNSQYDFIFSQLTVEHIEDIGTFYGNVCRLLAPGGMAYFFFACITTVPSATNRLLPDFLSRRILLLVQPFRKNEKHGKFKAYYKWCFGPTSNNIRRLENAGFEVVSYTGYFGHSYYQRIRFLNFLEKTKTDFLLKHPNPYFCSYAHVLLRKNH